LPQARRYSLVGELTSTNNGSVKCFMSMSPYTPAVQWATTQHLKKSEHKLNVN